MSPMKVAGMKKEWNSNVTLFIRWLKADPEKYKCTDLASIQSDVMSSLINDSITELLKNSCHHLCLLDA